MIDQPLRHSVAILERIESEEFDDSSRVGDLDALRAAIDAETRAEQAKDRAYWEPLRRELEEFRCQERTGAAPKENS